MLSAVIPSEHSYPAMRLASQPVHQGCVHLQFYGFLPRFLLGAALGYLFLFSGSIWASIVAHFINNALAVLLFFLTFNGYLTFDMDALGTQNTWWLGFLSLTLVCLLFYRLNRIKE